MYFESTFYPDKSLEREMNVFFFGYFVTYFPMLLFACNEDELHFCFAIKINKI